MTTDVWRRWLLLACGLVATYGISLVVLGDPAGRLFDLLGFGMRDAVPAGERPEHLARFAETSLLVRPDK